MPFPPLNRILLALALCLLMPVVSRADNWEARIHEKGAPAALVGVDKKRRTFNFFEKRSPLSLRYQYPCVTGQLTGDKQQVNDLKTPEGVYFVEYRIANGLDFREYGGIAYTLNYPNPVDKLRGKTGYGIWIHSKGFDLVPTRGCVAIDLKNIAEIGPKLTPGLPVVLAEELAGVTSFDNGTPAQLISLMESWTNAWAARSPQMFDYYDPDAYSRATENFDAFRQNKERLFKILNYIKIYNREIHALEGPGYWVTWAEQLYAASNLSTEGVRRLYWQKDNDGQFRIVGMEWIPRNLGMAAEYKQGKLVASLPAGTATDASSEAPVAPRLDMPEQAAANAELPRVLPTPAPIPAPASGDARTSPSLGDRIRQLTGRLLAANEPLVPEKQQRPNPPDEIRWGIGRKLAEPADKTSPSTTVSVPGQTESASQPEAPAVEKAPSAESGENSKPEEKPVAPALSPEEEKDVKTGLAAWNENYRALNPEIFNLYDQKLYNRLPAEAGVPRTGSLNSVRQNIRTDFTRRELFVITRDPIVEPQGDLVKTSQDVMFVSNRGKRQGVQNIWWKKDGDGNYKIVGSQFNPQPLGLEANYLELVSGDIAKMLEDWRKAWESASIDDYMVHYLPDAAQSGRVGANTIRYQKAGLWSRIRPTLVQLSGLRLTMEPDGIRADMTQSFADSAGRSDKGVKTLLLRYDGKQWRIKREDWAAAQEPKRE